MQWLERTGGGSAADPFQDHVGLLERSRWNCESFFDFFKYKEAHGGHEGLPF
jgi:hypothetical protein